MESHCLNPICTVKETFEKMFDVYEKKNRDYGNSFDQTINEWGEIAAITRIQDKWNRLRQLVKHNNPQVNESINDTLLDLANYAVLYYVWRVNHNEN